MKKLFRPMVVRYLRNVTTGHFDHHDEHADDMSEYDRYIELTREEAERYGHLEDLRIGTQLILQSSDDVLQEDLSSDYRWPRGELARVLRYVHAQLWPDVEIPENGPAGAEWTEPPDRYWTYEMPGNLKGYEEAKRAGLLDKILERLDPVDQVIYQDDD